MQRDDDWVVRLKPIGLLLALGVVGGLAASRVATGQTGGSEKPVDDTNGSGTRNGMNALRTASTIVAAF